MVKLMGFAVEYQGTNSCQPCRRPTRPLIFPVHPIAIVHRLMCLYA